MWCPSGSSANQAKARSQAPSWACLLKAGRQPSLSSQCQQGRPALYKSRPLGRKPAAEVLRVGRFYLKQGLQRLPLAKKDRTTVRSKPAAPCLPCPALPCPALPCPALLWPPSPCYWPSLPCPCPACPALPCPALPCLAPALPSPAVARFSVLLALPALPCPPCLALPCCLPCPALPCPALPCPVPWPPSPCYWPSLPWQITAVHNARTEPSFYSRDTQVRS